SVFAAADYLQLGDGRLTALKKVENMDIRWTDGFLLLGKQAP
ncbi:GDA1/CD39 protein, partial [Pseudomonas syringae pv. berberidis]